MLKRRILMVIPQNNFRDEELLDPRKIFVEDDFDVTVASEKLMVSTGALGASVTVEEKVTDAKVEDYDAVIFVGGSGIEEYRVYENVHYLNLAKAFSAAGRLVCAICAGPKVLAAAGLLTGKKATIWAGGADYIRARGADYTGEDVTIDENVITASGPHAAKKFAVAILRGLGEGRSS